MVSTLRWLSDANDVRALSKTRAHVVVVSRTLRRTRDTTCCSFIRWASTAEAEALVGSVWLGVGHGSVEVARAQFASGMVRAVALALELSPWHPIV
jgi:hypothetical protein